MSKLTLSDWAQVLTSIAVIVGLGLVVWELQITRQVSIDTYALITTSDETSDNSAMYGERAAEVVAKACFEPNSLSNAELFILDRYFENRVHRVFQVLWQGKFSSDLGWEQIATVWLRTILSYPQGEIYLRNFVFVEDEGDIEKLIQGLIAAGNYPNCRDVIGRLRVEG